MAEPPGKRPLPYPDSLCHGCAAPPRYIHTEHSTFVLCPLLPTKYPRQPVKACAMYRPKQAGDPTQGG